MCSKYKRVDTYDSRGNIDATTLSDANDAAWTAFSSANFVHGVEWTYPYFARQVLNTTEPSVPLVTLPTTSQALALGAPEFSSKFYADAVTTANTTNSALLSAQYVEMRSYMFIPMVTEIGGTRYTLRDLYGIADCQVKTLGKYGADGGECFGRIESSASLGNPYGSQPVQFTNSWTQYELWYGFVSASMFQDANGNTPTTLDYITSFPSFSSTDPRRLTDTAVESGISDLATTQIGSAVSYTGSFTEFSGWRGLLQCVLPAGSIVDTTPTADFLLLLIKVPDSSVVKSTPTSTNIFHTDGYPHFNGYSEAFGPTQEIGVNLNKLYQAPYNTVGIYGFLGVRPDFEILDHDILKAWGCIQSMSVRVDIDQNSSTIIEEDRTKTANYLSGSGLSKKFRIEDTSPSAGGALDEILDITTAANTLWVNNDPSGLDYTTEYPSIPSATTTIGWDEDDDNEGQEYNLSSVSLSHQSGTIAATIYVYADSTEPDRDITAEIYAGGSWSSPQTLDWSISSGWKYATLETGLSVSDFSGAKIRLTTQNIGGGGDTGDYSRVYVKIESTASPVVTRQCDVFLTESSGTYYLNFDYERESGTNDEDYYIEPDPAFGNQSHGTPIAVGPGETYETINDLEGTELVFTHSGTDNATPAKGIVDATVRITIESIAIALGS